MSQTRITGLLNKFELDNFNYQVDIKNQIKIDSTLSTTATSDNQNTPIINEDKIIRIKSIHGQMYECQLPDTSSVINNELTYSEDENSENDQYGAASAELSFFKSSGSNMPPSKIKYNFSLINEKVKSQMEDLKKSKLCIFAVKFLNV